MVACGTVLTLGVNSIGDAIASEFHAALVTGE